MGREIANLEPLYPGIRVSLLASRNQYCLHTPVSKLRAHAQSSACRGAIGAGSCQHYTNYKNMSKPLVNTVRAGSRDHNLHCDTTL